jgi:hypothetical protein
LEEVLITGASGSIGKMLAARETTHDLVRQTVRFRHDAPLPIDPDCTLLLHLANVGTSVEENLRLNRKLAEAIVPTKINQVILPQSFSTIGQLRTSDPNPEEFNYGFRSTMRDPYPQGKLKVEEFWLKWQSGSPDRKLLLLYIPTIVGPHSRWSNAIARFAPNQTLLVPKLKQFFAVLEVELVEVFGNLLSQGLERPVERRLALTICESLRAVVARDRVGPIYEFDVPATLRWLYRMTERNVLIAKIVTLHEILLRKGLCQATSWTILPLSAKWIRLFLRQEEISLQSSI